MSQPIEGRWCGACGGELLYRRRREEGLIVTYLACQFCSELTPILNYDVTTGNLTVLTEPSRACDLCGQVKRHSELRPGTVRGRRGSGFVVGCRGGCKRTG